MPSFEPHQLLTPKKVFSKKLRKIESSKKLNRKLSLLNFIKKIIVENA